MGLLDQVLASFGGSSSTGGSAIQGVLAQLLGGGGAAGSGAGGGGLGGMLGSLLGGGSETPVAGAPVAGSPLAGTPAVSGAPSGLSGLLQRFQGAGLGDVAQSWVGTGANRPVSPDQVQQALGDHQVTALAEQANMPKHDLLSQLSQYLPQLVDKLTPNGHLPPGSGPTTNV